MNATTAKMVAGVLMLLCWFALVAMGKTDTAPLISLLHDALVGLVTCTLYAIDPAAVSLRSSLVPGSVVNIGAAFAADEPKSAPAKPALVPAAETGFALPGVMLMLAVVALLCLSGCAAVQQAVSGYEAAATKGIKAAEDNNIEAWTAVACGTPFSAAIRHPDVIPALKALCLPGGQASSPASLLDAAQLGKPIGADVLQFFPAAAATPGATAATK